MRRLMLAALLLAAATVAVQPILHQHSLIPAGEDEHGVLSPAAALVCTICAIGADRVVLTAPAVVAPLLVAFAFVSILPALISREAQIALASRAPPRA
ncbi:MAG TPA: hypothetical protein VMU84_21825 [Thermoanaerobaculia bacterium]|nr:hypothetical protein [Thermoanaerobaculia bacterium]